MRRLRARLLGRLAADLHRLAATVHRWAGDAPPVLASAPPPPPGDEAPEAAWHRIARPEPPAHWVALLRERAPHLLTGGWRIYRTPAPPPVLPASGPEERLEMRETDLVWEPPAEDASGAQGETSAAPRMGTGHRPAGTSWRSLVWPGGWRALLRRAPWTDGADHRRPAAPRPATPDRRSLPGGGFVPASDAPLEPTSGPLLARGEDVDRPQEAAQHGPTPQGTSGTVPTPVREGEPGSGGSPAVVGGHAGSPVGDPHERIASAAATLRDEPTDASAPLPRLAWPPDLLEGWSAPPRVFPDEGITEVPRPPVWRPVASPSDWPPLPALSAPAAGGASGDGAHLERLAREQEGL